MKSVFRRISDYLWYECGSNAGLVRRFKIYNIVDIYWARITKELSGFFYRLSKDYCWWVKDDNNYYKTSWRYVLTFKHKLIDLKYMET